MHTVEYLVLALDSLFLNINYTNCHSGLNRTDRGKGYTHCLVARLSVADPDNAPLAELDAYQKHPLHLEAVKIMKEIAAGVLAGMT